MRLENKKVIFYKKEMERPNNCPSPECFIIHILPKVDEVRAGEIIQSSCGICIQLANNQKALDVNIEKLLKPKINGEGNQPNNKVGASLPEVPHALV